MKFCTKCGNQLADDMLFCQKCGAKVENEPQQDSVAPQYDVLDMSETTEPIKKKQPNKQGVRAVGIVVLVFVLIVMLIVGGTKGCSSTPTNQGQTENTEVVCDVSKFANITSAELVELLGEPNKVEKTTTNGFAKFPCVYYDYNNENELGEVSFILINDTVVKLVSYNTYPYNDGKKLLESFNLTMGENGAKNTTDTYARFRCPTDKVDDLWITNIDKSANTFGSLQVTYDMFYFEEWYIPLTDITEETNYQVWTQNSVKSLLKTPKTAKFPSILDWEIFKNEFYVLASAYVDAQNSFGATVRSEFAFVYKVDTSSIVYAVFDGEVIANNGYVKTEELVSKLIDNKKTDSALNTKPSNKNDTNSTETPSKTESTKDNTTNKPSSNTTTATPTFTGSLCTNVNSSTGMPQNNITNFEITDTIYVAGKLSGVTGENNLIIRYTYPDGSTDDTMQYCIVNNETINTGLNASVVGSGNGKVQVILEKTGKVLATYNFTVKTTQNNSNNQRPTVEEDFEQVWKNQTLNADWISEYELQQLSGESDLCFDAMISSYSAWSNGQCDLVYGFFLQGISSKELLFVYDMPKSFYSSNSGTGKYNGINFKIENGKWYFRPADLISVGLLKSDGSFNSNFTAQTFDVSKAK